MAKFEIFNKIFHYIFGVLLCLLLFAFVLVNVPVYIYRLLVILLAKCFRSDFGDIVGGLSAFYAGDYMHNSAPRANIVVNLHLNGSITIDKFKQLITKQWIESEKDSKNFTKFFHYPVPWLGYLFWRNGRKSFSVDNHVRRLLEKNYVVTKQDLDTAMEQLLNKPFSKNRSPWEFYMAENYQDPNNPEIRQTVVVFKVHHCLSDGFGIQYALLELVKEETQQMESLTNVSFPTLKLSRWQKFKSFFVLPLKVFCEACYLCPFNFKSSALKIPNEKKKWHQHLAKSEPISIQEIKEIKNKFGVRFGSVLLSAISSAISKTVATNENSMLFMMVLPSLFNNRKVVLSNHLSAAIVDLPVKSYENCLDRLLEVNKQVKKTKASAFPMMTEFLASINGALLHRMCSFMAKNKMVSLGMSNFAGVPANLQPLQNAELVRVDAIAGALDGVAGMAITVVNSNSHIQIQATVEAAIMSKSKLENFLTLIVDEFSLLGRQCPNATKEIEMQKLPTRV